MCSHSQFGVHTLLALLQCLVAHRSTGGETSRSNQLTKAVDERAPSAGRVKKFYYYLFGNGTPWNLVRSPLFDRLFPSGSWCENLLVVSSVAQWSQKVPTCMIINANTGHRIIYQKVILFFHFHLCVNFNINMWT